MILSVWYHDVNQEYRSNLRSTKISLSHMAELWNIYCVYSWNNIVSWQYFNDLISAMLNKIYIILSYLILSYLILSYLIPTLCSLLLIYAGNSLFVWINWSHYFSSQTTSYQYSTREGVLQVFATPNLAFDQVLCCTLANQYICIQKKVCKNN